MSKGMKFSIACIVIYFLVLYIIAFLANRHSREDDDILWVSKHQWHGLLVMWLPSLVLLIK